MNKERFMKDFNGEKIFSLEYDKETLKDMVLEKQEEIERLNKSLEEQRHFYLDQLQQKENIIKEVRELVENGTNFKSIYFKKDKEDLWKVILADEIKEEYLKILDKGSEMKNDKRSIN